eukprot:2220275-Amphidinium_carterae.2
MSKLAIQRDLSHDPDALHTEENYIKYIHNLQSTYSLLGSRAQVAKRVTRADTNHIVKFSRAAYSRARDETRQQLTSSRRTSQIDLDYDYTVYRDQ